MSDERIAEDIIRGWRTGANIAGELARTGKLKALENQAKTNKTIRRLLLKELERNEKSADRYFSSDLAEMLARTEDHELLPDLFRIFKDKNRSVENRYFAGTCIGRFGKPALAMLSESLKSPDDFERDCAAASLGHLGVRQEPAGIPLLLEALKDEVPRIRATAAGALRTFPPEISAPYLQRALQAENAYVRANAASTLSYHKVYRAEAERVLIELLGHPNVEVRADAVAAFWNFEDSRFSKAAVAPLQSLLQDRDRQIRAGAVRGLGRLGPAAAPAVTALIEVLKDDEMPEIRADAARSLGEIGPSAQAAVSALIVFAQSNNIQAGAGVVALGKIGPAASEAIPVLEKMLQEDQEDWVAARALEKIRGR